MADPVVTTDPAVVTPAPQPFWTGHENDMVTVKVDGVEQQVPFKDVQAGYQMAKASTKRFEEAKRLSDEAEARRATPAQPIGASPGGLRKPKEWTTVEWDSWLERMADTFPDPSKYQDGVNEQIREQLTLHKLGNELESALDKHETVIKAFGGRQKAFQLLWGQFRTALEESQGNATAEELVADMEKNLTTTLGVTVTKPITTLDPERGGQPAGAVVKEPDKFDKKGNLNPAWTTWALANRKK
jgi:hypothetical protein